MKKIILAVTLLFIAVYSINLVNAGIRPVAGSDGRDDTSVDGSSE